jgi:hypothetical protein
MCQPFPFQGPPKFTQIGIFGLKKCHLATLTVGRGTPEFNLGTLTDVEGAL